MAAQGVSPDAVRGRVAGAFASMEADREVELRRALTAATSGVGAGGSRATVEFVRAGPADPGPAGTAAG